jgi:hypothetical protein
VCKALGIKTIYEVKWPLPNSERVTDRDFWHFRQVWGEFPFKGVCHSLSKEKSTAWVGIYLTDKADRAGGGFAVVMHEGAHPEYWDWFSECRHEFTRQRLGHFQLESKCVRINS